MALDACYLALGLVLQPGEHERTEELLAGLQRHCAVADPAYAHLLRRRAAWLLGYLLRSPAGLYATLPHALAPNGVGEVAAQPQAQTAAAHAVGMGGDPLWFAMLSQLLSDEHPGVRLTAAISLRSLLDATATSPRHAPLLSPDTTALINGGSSGHRGGGHDGMGGGGSWGALHSDMLARLSASALMPVLQLSLSVNETGMQPPHLEPGPENQPPPFTHDVARSL